MQVQHLVTFGPDRFAIQMASLGLVTNTIAPSSVGMHSPGGSRIGFSGDRGYGVNRWAGRTPYEQGTLQNFAAPVRPVADPQSKRVGAGAMPSGGPGLPSTGVGASAGFVPLAWMSWGQGLDRQGIGG